MDRFVVIDLETTGHSPDAGDKIIEIGLVVIENQKITKTYESLVYPERSIPPFIQNLTAITDEDVAKAPFFSEIASDIISIIKDSYVIAHNVPFDIGFLNGELAQINEEAIDNLTIDTVELARILYPRAPGYQLNQLAHFLNIDHDDPHRALSDAYVTAELFIKMQQKLSALPYETLDYLLTLEPYFHSHLYYIIKKYHETKVYAQNEPHINTFNGIAFKHFKHDERIEDAMHMSYGDFLEFMYDSKDGLQKTLQSYEPRDGQRQMSEHVYDAFKLKKHFLIEAGTGIGKSLAYLIPALYNAVTTGEKTVISTHTTQLQLQLIEKELALLNSIVPFNFSFALLKGKSHYISLERFWHSLQRIDDNYDLTLSKAMILVWLTETKTGDVAELQLPASGYQYFKSISAEAEQIKNKNSPWNKYSYYRLAYEKARRADILIVNHTLLAIDIKKDYQILPTYKRAIIDEAHHFSQIAERTHGLTLDYLSIHFILNQLNPESQQMSYTLKQLLKNQFIDIDLDQWAQIINHSSSEVDDFFRQLHLYVREQNKRAKTYNDIGRLEHRMTIEHLNSSKWQQMIEQADRIHLFLTDINTYLTKLTKHDLTINEQNDLQHLIESLNDFTNKVQQIFNKHNKNSQIIWLEIERGGAENAVYIYTKPKNINTLLKDHFFSKKESIVLTSATLTMRDSFTYMQKSLGLIDENIETYTIESPFNYEKQVKVMVPEDFPTINDQPEDFIYSTSEAIISLAEITKGRMLVLFTSYDMLRQTYNILRETLDLDQYMLIAQGITTGSRSRLTKEFQTFDRSILLGTSSFWEGVDIPGDDLSAIVMVRLPFQRPNEPAYAAKAEQLEKAGKNAFFELALPEAVIKFKQGFGRLIRSSSDRGIVFICDTRIVNARYGHFFHRSLPNVEIINDSTTQLMKKAEKWL